MEMANALPTSSSSEEHRARSTSRGCRLPSGPSLPITQPLPGPGGCATRAQTIPFPRAAHRYMDAELFKRRLQERSPEVQLQVAALSLAQVIAAYSSDEVKGAEARERFVLIPTMSAVSDALELMPVRLPRRRSLRIIPLCGSRWNQLAHCPCHPSCFPSLRLRAQEPPPPERLSAASGLVPVFHVPSLLAQSASGKQRKILFFRKVSTPAVPKDAR